MKRSHQCPKCSGSRIVHLRHVIDATEWEGEREFHRPEDRRPTVNVRRTLAVAVRTKKLLGPLQSVDVEPTALTEAYVCTACGYFEEYVVDVRDIPWDAVEGASYVTP